MREFDLSDLVDQVMHLTQLATYTKGYYIEYNDNELNHSELETEVKQLIDEVNFAVDKFQHVVRTKLWAVLCEINKNA